MNNELINELKQSAVTKGARYQALLAQGNELSSAELNEASTLGAELKEIKAKLDLFGDAEVKNWLSSSTNPFNHSNGTNKEEATVTVEKDGTVKTHLKGFTVSQMNAVCSNAYGEAFDQYMRKGRDRMDIGAYKTLQEGQDISGGFLVPEQVQAMLVQKKQGMTSVSDRVRRMTTGRDSLTVPRSNYTTDNIYTSPVRVTKTGEIPASASTATITDPTFGQTKIDVFTYMANGSITRDMLEDGLFDVQGFLADKFSEAVNQKTEDLVINGTGQAQPTGILAAPGTTLAGQVQPDYVALGLDATNRLTADGLVNLAYSLEPQYDNNAVFVFNKTNTARGMFQIKDSQNRYMFAEGYQDSGLAGAKPKELLGYQYLYSNLMPNGYNSTCASGVVNAYPIIFGDLTGYYMVERAGLTVQVLDQTLATLNQVQLVARWRFGGSVVEPWKIKVGKVSSS